MVMFACFAPSCVVKDNESKEYSIASNGSKKGSSKGNRRVKPVVIVSPTTMDNYCTKRRSKLGRRVKPIDIVSPSSANSSKRRIKWGIWDKSTDIASPSAKDSSKKTKKWGFGLKPTDIKDSCKKKRSKRDPHVKPIDITSPAADGGKKRRNKWGLQVKNVDIVKPSTEKVAKNICLPVSESPPYVEKTASVSLYMVNGDRFSRTEPTGAYQLSDEHDEIGLNTEKDKTEKGITLQTKIARRHAGDPWMEQTTFKDTQVLTRSCSNIETKQAVGLEKLPKRPSSCNNLENLSGNGKIKITDGTVGSPLSAWTSHSADCVRQTRVSLSQVLPSRSHSNLNRYRTPERLISFLSDLNKKDAYSSDMYEPYWRIDDKTKQSVEIVNQWFSSSSAISHFDRVSAWVNSLEHCSFFPVDVEERCDEVEKQVEDDLHDLELGESVENGSHTCHHEKDIVQPNHIIQSLNSFSSVAHISSKGLKVVPSLSAFVYLRTAILCNNCIVDITPGSLPRSLHTLDLSRNKISDIEGLENLERLRVLNLSYNRISRIGHGLSNCTLIKELYLTGNKISIIEGLHRVLKLTVLDLSFNKLSSTKALGQLVGNYNCLLALNLVGNPIQANLGDDQLKKEVSNLLPNVTYLNKHCIKPHKVHAAPANSGAKAALGDAHQRRITRRTSHGSGSPSKRRAGEGSFKSIKHRSKSMYSSPGRR